MRHVLANIVTYAIAILLFLGAALFARMRASQYTLTYQSEVLAVYEPTAAREFEWAELGAETYRRNCSNCHGQDGGGWDEYPPVRGVVDDLREPGGRERLIDLHLDGLSSPDWGAPMPKMRHLHDVEIAAVLNHVITRFDEAGGVELFRPDEVRARRKRR